MRNLVTGGAGFVGSHLIDSLMKAGEQVICLDNFVTGSKRNIQHWINNPKFELITHDVIIPIELEVNRIWHLACPASPVHYQNNPIKTAKTSFLGTYNMLGMAKRLKARLLLASTSEIYGDPEVHPQTESYKGSVNPIGIRSCYDEGKRIAESLCFDYFRTHNTKIRVARIFNTYGPRMMPNDGRVVSNFICQAINNQPLTVYGNGEQTRSLCYVNDLVEGLLKLMNSNHTGPINLGNDEELKIITLAEIIKNKINSNININRKPMPQDDPSRRKPDLALANNILDWSPQVNIDKGLDYTISYFKEVFLESESL